MNEPVPGSPGLRGLPVVFAGGLGETSLSEEEVREQRGDTGRRQPVGQDPVEGIGTKDVGGEDHRTPRRGGTRGRHAETRGHLGPLAHRYGHLAAQGAGQRLGVDVLARVTHRGVGAATSPSPR